MNAEPVIEVSVKASILTADEVIRRFLPDVYAYVYRRIPVEEDAEDVTAETFQAAIQSLHRRRGADPKLWLLGIARRKVVDAYRRKQRRRERPLEAGDRGAESIQTDLERAHDCASIRKIILALPEDQREALLLQHLEGLSIAEIASVMDRSAAAVNSLLQRARARAYQEGKGLFLEEIS